MIIILKNKIACPTLLYRILLTLGMDHSGNGSLCDRRVMLSIDGIDRWKKKSVVKKHSLHFFFFDITSFFFLPCPSDFLS